MDKRTTKTLAGLCRQTANCIQLELERRAERRESTRKAFGRTREILAKIPGVDLDSLVGDLPVPDFREDVKELLDGREPEMEIAQRQDDSLGRIAELLRRLADELPL